MICRLLVFRIQQEMTTGYHIHSLLRGISRRCILVFRHAIDAAYDVPDILDKFMHSGLLNRKQPCICECPVYRTTGCAHPLLGSLFPSSSRTPRTCSRIIHGRKGTAGLASSAKESGMGTIKGVFSVLSEMCRYTNSLAEVTARQVRRHREKTEGHLSCLPFQESGR